MGLGFAWADTTEETYLIKEKLEIVQWKKVQNVKGKMESNCVRFYRAGGNTQDLCCSSDVGQDATQHKAVASEKEANNRQ